jgi:tol-pal system protein YbgF
MKKLYLLIFTIFFINITAYADMYCFDSLENEIRKLTNRIEILEHEVMLLKQNGLQSSDNAMPQEVNKPEEKVAPSPKIVEPEFLPSSEKQIYDMALSKLKDKRYGDAKIAFAQFIKKYPKSQMLDRALFWYAESFAGSKEFQNAALYYLQCYQKAPKGQKAQDALIKLAVSLSALKRNAEVCKIINKLENEFSNRSASIKKTVKDLKVKHSCK